MDGRPNILYIITRYAISTRKEIKANKHIIPIIYNTLFYQQITNCHITH